MANILVVAHELEKLYPSPSLHIDDPIVVQVRDHLPKILNPLGAHFMPRVPLLLPERSAEYFNETRGKLFGAPLTEVGKNASEDAWKQVEAPIKEMGDWLRKHDGPFFLGETGKL